MEQPVINENEIHQVFEISIALKAIHGALEVLLGILLFFPITIRMLIYALTQSELIEDPNDYVARTVQHLTPFLALHSSTFAAYYLLSHGVIKLILAILLFQKKLWAYPLTIATLVGFIAYQIYRYTFTHSLMLIILTVFDITVIGLVWHEYQNLKKHRTPIPLPHPE
jgi:uncharacterized membrane protein